MTHVLAILTLSYLLGSIPVGYLAMRWGKGIDIRTVGSGNIGMTNVWRAAGWRWGVPVLLLDIAKGAVAVILPVWLFPDQPQLLELRVGAGLFVILGNVFSVFLQFKGGKGVGTAIGVFLFLLPVSAMASFIAFGVAILLSRMISVGSLMAAATLTAVTLATRHPFDLLSALAVLATCGVVWTHRANIRRIIAGKEHRIFDKAAPANKS